MKRERLIASAPAEPFINKRRHEEMKSVVAAKQQEQMEAKERYMTAINQHRHKQLTDLLCEEVFTVEDLCGAAWEGGDISRFRRMLNFLSVEEINKTNSRGQTALVCTFLKSYRQG